MKRRVAGVMIVTLLAALEACPSIDDLPPYSTDPGYTPVIPVGTSEGGTTLTDASRDVADADAADGDAADGDAAAADAADGDAADGDAATGPAPP